MTWPDQGFAEAVARHNADLDAAVGRARRVAAEAREDNAGLRRQSREVADGLHAKQLKIGELESTPEDLRNAAREFRTERGLPVEEFEESGEFAVANESEPPKRRPVPQSGDDDEDFSQERIMTRRT